MVQAVAFVTSACIDLIEVEPFFIAGETGAKFPRIPTIAGFHLPPPPRHLRLTFHRSDAIVNYDNSIKSGPR